MDIFIPLFQNCILELVCFCMSIFDVFACVCMFICVELTLAITLAEFLTKVLCHHTWTGAITWVLRVVTWLIIVHLIGWVVCMTNRKVNKSNNKGSNAVWTKTFHYVSRHLWLLHKDCLNIKNKHQTNNYLTLTEINKYCKLLFIVIS